MQRMIAAFILKELKTFRVLQTKICSFASADAYLQDSFGQGIVNVVFRRVMAFFQSDSNIAMKVNKKINL